MTNYEMQSHTTGTNPLIEVLAIYICAEKGDPMEWVEAADVIAGVGLAGDRYAARTGAFSGSKRLPDEDRQVTFISRPAIEEANVELQAMGEEPYTEAETRRNIVINIGPAELNALKDAQFLIGGILFEGVELCDPCDRPRKLAGKQGDFKTVFEGRGGLRARALTDGTLWVWE